MLRVKLARIFEREHPIGRGLLMVGAAAMMLSYGSMSLAQDPPQCAETSPLEISHSPNASQLCAALDVQDGRLIVVGSRSRLYPSDVIDKGRPVTDARRLELQIRVQVRLR